MEQDRQAAIAVWFLKILAEPWLVESRDIRDGSDLLLGIHILAGLIRAEQKTSVESSSPP
jgi:hypothetical protein